MASTIKGGNLGATPADVFATSSTQATDLGAFVTTGDGRGYRYVLAGATALVPGKLYQAPAEDTTNMEDLGIITATVGATSVTTGSAVTLTAGQLAGGFLAITKGSGAGYFYKIANNTAATSATTTITLQDPIAVALNTATTHIDVHPGTFNGVIVDPTTATSTPVGVAVSAIPASNYGWLQTHGPTNVLAQGALLVGMGVTAANASAAGAVAPAVGSATALGYAITGVASTEYGQVFLTID